MEESHARPQTQVGAQKVEECHDVQSVHGDPSDGDLVGEGDEDRAAGPDTMVEVVFLQGILQSDSTVPLMMPPIYKSEKRWIYRIRDIETYLKC